MTLEGLNLGKYRLISLLGKGGMAEVYLAEHELLQAKVAVKILPPEFARDPGMVDRFMREARAAARLHHPHIIRIHDVGSENGINYFSMDYLEGTSLAKIISQPGGQDTERIYQISQQVLSALAEAHQAGIVHRDIKPDNVIIDQRGSATVTDFGIAKATSDSHLTITGAFVGTPRYASPEQVQGQEVDGRSDLYSWALVMYEMATGRHAFRGPDTAAYIYQQAHEIPPAPHDLVPGLPPGLSALILKALEKRPADRFGTANAMLAALERALPGQGGGQGNAAGPGPQARARALLKQAQDCLQQGRWRSGQALAAKARELDSGLAEAAQIMAQADAELERDERISNLTVEAQACLNEGLYEQAGTLITELMEVSRDKDRTMAWLREVLELQNQAHAVQGQLQMGQALEKSGDPRAALALYQTLAQSHPDLAEVSEALARLQGRLAVQELAERAHAAAEHGDLRAAQDLYLQAMRQEPGNSLLKAKLQDVQGRMSRGQRLQALLAQGRQLMESQDLPAAQRVLSEAVSLDPSATVAVSLLADVQRRVDVQPVGQAVASLSPGPNSRPKLAGPTVMQPPPIESARPTQAAGRAGLRGWGRWAAVGGAVLLVLAVGLGLWPRSPAPLPPAPPVPVVAPPSETPPSDRQEVPHQRAEIEPLAQEASRISRELEDKIETLLEQGEARAAAGRFEEAAEMWREALALKPDSLTVQKKLSGLQERRQAWAQEHAARQSPRSDQAASDGRRRRPSHAPAPRRAPSEAQEPVVDAETGLNNSRGRTWTSSQGGQEASSFQPHRCSALYLKVSTGEVLTPEEKEYLRRHCN